VKHYHLNLLNIGIHGAESNETIGLKEAKQKWTRKRKLSLASGRKYAFKFIDKMAKEKAKGRI